MKALKIQFKNIRKDKLCILTFLLPVVVGVIITLLSGMNISSISETSFYVVKNDLSNETIQWLQKNGRVDEFESQASMKEAVKNPTTQGIGVLSEGEGIKTWLSGDEYQVNTMIGNTLPQLYEQKGSVDSLQATILPTKSDRNALISLIVVITMVAAMFMGCTFNAMSMLNEKEEGISLIHEVLPMTKRGYVFQKISLGFIGSVFSTLLTALVCMRITVELVIPFLLLIVLSAFVAALIGLFVGYFSKGLMIGIVVIKVIMILFIAPPIFFYLSFPSNSIQYALSYFLPSSATFYGLMDLLNNQTQDIGIYIFILLIHCIVWLQLFLFIVTHQRKESWSQTSSESSLFP